MDMLELAMKQDCRPESAANQAFSYHSMGEEGVDSNTDCYLMTQLYPMGD